MIYETAIVVRSDADDSVVKKVGEIVKKSVAAVKGEILLEDDWGVKTFAQPAANGKTQGRYIYFIYEADGQVNTEIERLYRITEEVMKSIIVKLGEDERKDSFVKDYRNSSAEKSDEKRIDESKEKRLFQKRKSCWFSAKKTQPDWKDPKSYSWLVNEFGKVSPARITGLRPKYQRMATTAIKRGRCMGLISYMSDQVAR